MNRFLQRHHGTSTVFATAIAAVVLVGCTDTSESTVAESASRTAEKSSHAAEASGESPVVVDPVTETVLLYNVTGMTCDGCAMSIENAVTKIAGVKRCLASFEQGTARVVVTEPEIADAVGKAIADQGYGAEQATDLES